MDCPSEQTLLEYVSGDLPEETALAIDHHIAVCSVCHDAVQWVQTHLMNVSWSDDLEESTVELTRQPAKMEFEEDSADALDDSLHIDGLDPPQHPNSLGRLGPYELLDMIGQGAMGLVLKAYDAGQSRVVAIKVLKPEMADSETARQRFVREAQAAAAIDHPNVVSIHSVEEQNGLPYLVMEYIEGRTLKNRLREAKKLDVLETIRLSTQIANGLAAAHQQGVIHRDIKPANIMLERKNDRVKLTDFGLARITLDNLELTSRDVMLGTPAYMAPEQACGEKVDARADLFSLGCVMYAMLLGHSPFHGQNILEMAHKVAEHDPPPPSSLDASIPESLSQLVMKLLDKKADLRWGSAEEVVSRLNDHSRQIDLAESGQVAALVPPSQDSSRKDSSREDSSQKDSSEFTKGRKRLLLLVAVSLLALSVLGVVVALLVVRRLPPPKPITVMPEGEFTTIAAAATSMMESG